MIIYKYFSKTFSILSISMLCSGSIVRIAATEEARGLDGLTFFGLTVFLLLSVPRAIGVLLPIRGSLLTCEL